MARVVTYLTVLYSLFIIAPAAGQVVESDPNPARTDQSVTITFHADRGSQGLKDCNCDVYAHTGLITSKSDSDSDWRYVMDEWPENRPKTKLKKVNDNTYELTIDDIRKYYSDNNTGAGKVPPKSEEEIKKLAFVFRNSDGSKTGKTEGGGDIFVEVNDVGGNQPFLAANIVSPSANPPLYPYMTAKDTTVNVEISADTANVDTFSKLRLFVNGSKVDSTTSTSLTYPLQTGQNPNRFRIRAEAEATVNDSTLRDALETSIIRTPNVVDEARPSGVEDGINYNSDGSVTLSLFAPKKDFVYAIGDFTNWKIDNQYFMKREKTKNGAHWWITIDGLDPTKQYDFQYFVDGEIRTSDPFAHKVRTPADDGISEEIYPGLQSYPGNKTEGFVSVIRPGQQQDDFQFSKFQAPKRENLVIYELLLRDFVEKSSFKVLKDTLSYLDRLGVNAVELMPVANFGGNNSWGYNPNAHLALDKSYGTPEGFKKFVEEAHSRGIAVIMDVVYNHVTDQSPLVQLYSDPSKNPFIETGSNRGVCGIFFRELNQGSPFIKRYINRANEYWIEKFNVDGFRFDLAKCVADNGVNINDPAHSDAVVSGWKRVADHVWDNVDEDTYMILEFFGSPSEENKLGGYRDEDGNTGSFMTWHNMNFPYGQVAMGYQEKSSISDTYYGNRGSYDQPSFIAYMESHDEQWLMRKMKAFGNSSGDYSTKDLETALSRQKLVGALYFTIPGPRMTWQFSELGYGWGKNECLKDDGEGGTCPESAPGRTAPKPIRWEYADSTQSPARDRLHDAWSALINLRNRTEVFSSTKTTVSTKLGGGDLTRRIVLEHDSMNAVVIANAGLKSREMSANFPSSGTWYDFFTGSKVNINSDETDQPISLAAGEFHVFTSEPVDVPESDLVPYGRAAPAPDAPTNAAAQVGTENITVSWTASSASDRTGYALYRGRRAQFDTTGALIARLDKGTTSYTDTETTPGTLYYYRVVALDDDGVSSALSSVAKGVVYPKSISFDVSRSFGQGSEKENYRLVALPGKGSRPLGQTLSGEAGSTWQAYWDDGSESDFFVQFDGSDTFTLSPGKGFWLISDSTWSVQAQGVSTVALSQEKTTTIDLHSGWNIISNPFDRDVPWSRVVSENGGGLQPLWSFGGSFSQTTTFASARSGTAFYFLNDQGLDQLAIPYVATPKRAEKETAASEERIETLTLEVGRDGKWRSAVRVGWKKKAEEGVDAFDWIAPPSRFASLSLRSRAEGAPSTRQKSLARNVRPRTERGQSFPLTLRSATKDPVRLRAKNIEAFAEQEMRLVNEKTGQTYDLREESSPELQPQSETTAFTLLIGTESYVREKQQALTASELRLRPGYPNPFRQKTTLSYTLPENGSVTLEVFDVLGRRVRVLVDERQEAGTYEVTWNGGNQDGQAVASGVYLGRLTFEGQTMTQKMVLVK